MSDTSRPALTLLSEDEKAFQEAVRDFAENEVVSRRDNSDWPPRQSRDGT